MVWISHDTSSMTMDANFEGGIPGGLPVGDYDIFSIDFNDPSLYLCIIAVFIAGVFASASGIGGGGIFVAVLMLIGDMSPHQAVPLSKALIFSGSIMSFFVNVQKTDELGRSLIQFNVIKNVVPMALGGTMLGVILNCYAPRAILVLCLASLLTVMSGKLLSQAYSTYKGENLSVEATSSSNSNYFREDTTDSKPGSRRNSYFRDDDDATPQTMASSMDRKQLQLEVGRRLEREELREMSRPCSPDRSHRGGEDLEDNEISSIMGGGSDAPVATVSGHLSPSKWGVLMQVPSRDVMILIAMLGCIITCGSIRHIFPEKSYWPHVILAFGLIICICIASYFWRQTKRASARHLDFENPITFKYPLVSFFTGICSGLMGIGGGLIFCPFFLMSGMDPTKAVVTSATCVIFTATSTTFQYLFLGRVMIYEAMLLGVVSFGASICGTMLIHWVKRTTGRSSPLIMIVAITVGVSCALLMSKGIRFALEDWFIHVPHSETPLFPVADPAQTSLYELVNNVTATVAPTLVQATNGTNATVDLVEEFVISSFSSSASTTLDPP